MQVNNENEMNLFFDKLKQLEIGTVLDIATGRGEFIDFLKQSLGKVDKIIGIDTHERMLQIAKDTFPDAELEIMDAYHLDFPDNSMDMTSISNSLHHFTDPELVIKEMIRVTKPGGYFVVREMLGDADQTESQKSHILIHHLSAEVDRMAGRVHQETYSEVGLRNLLESIPTYEREYAVYDYPVSQEEMMRNTERYSQLIDAIVKPLTEISSSKELREKAESIKEHIIKHGFAPARTLFYLGRK
ncbi:MAG: class I SAM-dependent methyltransferase [Candidatus Cloacimonetes bacterium]|nr:class I SAM-dependent methyltransferase [Candidatus Cloacimonadota bacterium]